MALKQGELQSDDEVLRQAQENPVLTERNRIAREIHDTLAQRMTALILHLERAKGALSNVEAEPLSHIARALELARASLVDTRRVIWALRPPELDEADLAGALRLLAERLTSLGTVRIDCSIWGECQLLPAEIEADLLRIAQEALNNAIRHGHPSQVLVTLDFSDRGVRLAVQDNGSGFDQRARRREGRLGLVSMRERAKRLAGALAIRSRPGRGTIIMVRVPRAALVLPEGLV